MLIQALSKYYDVLDQKDVFPEKGTSRVGIHFLIALNPDGTISEIVNHQRQEIINLKNGKTKTKFFPRDVILPQRTEKSAVEANYIEHRGEYIFGLNYNKKEETFDAKGNVQKKFDAFTKKNLAFIAGIHTPLIDAYRAFIDKWNPENELNNPALMENEDVRKQWKSSKFAFCLASDKTKNGILDYHIPEIKQRFQEIQEAEKAKKAKSAVKMQCAISGKIEPIARIHDKIKGIPDGNATGNVLVGYNESAFCSYGDEQAYNSKISESEMKKYTAALNYLLDGSDHKKVLGDMTLLYWAMDSDPVKDTLVEGMLNDVIDDDDYDDEEIDAESTNVLIHQLIKDAGQLTLLEKDLKNVDIDPNVDFYIVGIKPNAARIAIKMLYRKRFGDMISNIARFQRDIQIDDHIRTIPLWRIQKELIPPKASADNQKKFNPTLASKLLEAIISGSDLPINLFERMINRVKTDKDLKINRVRAGIIKGYLNQQYRKKKKEEFSMALNKENTNQAYLCGRLFAALQKTQEEVSDKKLNRTIRNAYFSSAATQPALVFPKLMMLYPHHLKSIKDRTDKKVDWKAVAVGREMLLQEIIGKLDGAFPVRLSLSEQGEFIIGYYQQYQDFFTKKENREEKDQKNQ